ncbi:MAG: hypothetical protein KGI80_00120 [Verrucomicrobiota bacterium]|nr:hypothetical protein [Verrucomicrobiota bacterium]
MCVLISHLCCANEPCCRSGEPCRQVCGLLDGVSAAAVTSAAAGAVAGTILPNIGPILGMHTGIAVCGPGTASYAIISGSHAHQRPTDFVMRLFGSSGFLAMATYMASTLLPVHSFCFAAKFTLLGFGIGGAGAYAVSAGSVACYNHFWPPINNQAEAQVELPAVQPVAHPPIHQPSAPQEITERYANLLLQAGEYFDADEAERPALLQTYPAELQAILGSAPNFPAAARSIQTSWREAISTAG